MVTKLILIAAVIAAAFFTRTWWKAPQRTRQQRWQAVLICAVIVAVVLAATGRLHPLLAALAAMLPVAMQLLANLARYSPLVARLWRDINRGQPGSAGRDDGAGTMTRDEALEILGLEQGASREDIINAHRRLIQKMHPDRGGSEYLATRINLARDALLAGNRP